MLHSVTTRFIAACLAVTICFPLSSATAGTSFFSDPYTQQESSPAPWKQYTSLDWEKSHQSSQGAYGPNQRSSAHKLLVMPVDGKITSGFGPRKLSRKSRTRMHKGIDISAPRGTCVVASGDGVIVAQARHRAYGKTIDIEHPNGAITRYAHLDSYTVAKGDKVRAGDQIGTVGRTGRTTGPNLHFEIILNGKQVNPLQASLWDASVASTFTSKQHTFASRPGQARLVADNKGKRQAPLPSRKAAAPQKQKQSSAAHALP